MVNLLEYALGGIPTNSSSMPLPIASTTNDGKLQLTFTRLRGDADYKVQATSDFSDNSPWSDIVFTMPAVGQPITVTDDPPSGATKRFLRLKVISP